MPVWSGQGLICWPIKKNKKKRFNLLASDKIVKFYYCGLL
jgi:hypothetical protein